MLATTASNTSSMAGWSCEQADAEAGLNLGGVLCAGTMGHINFGEFLIDRTGITERATLNGMTLMNWEVFGFPLDAGWVALSALRHRIGPADSSGAHFS